MIVNITGGPDLSLSEAAEATALITKAADPDANVIYGIVTDESMGNAVKVTVIATGFSRTAPKGLPLPPISRTTGDAAAGGAAGRGRRRRLERRLLPQNAGGQACRVGRHGLRSRRADVPAPQGRRRGGALMASFSRDFDCAGCGRGYAVSGDSQMRPGSETEVLAQFRCSCGHWMGAFVPASVDPDKLTVTVKGSQRLAADGPRPPERRAV